MEEKLPLQDGLRRAAFCVLDKTQRCGIIINRTMFCLFSGRQRLLGLERWS